jgi:hypothetical protein
MKYIYIAGPYSKGDPVINTGEAIKAGNLLAGIGYIPFIPHLTLFWHLIYPQEIEFWYEYDMAWLKKCDGLLRLPGESQGADREVATARIFGMPIYYSIQEVIDDTNQKV